MSDKVDIAGAIFHVTFTKDQLANLIHGLVNDLADDISTITLNFFEGTFGDKYFGIRNVVLNVDTYSGFLDVNNEMITF